MPITSLSEVSSKTNYPWTRFPSLNPDSWRPMAQDWSDETPFSLEFISPLTQMISMPSHSPFLRQARVLAVVVKVDSDDEINDDIKNTKQ
jgi:hypothetical protein